MSTTIALHKREKHENDFLADVLEGLNSEPKYLSSKYFYDAVGDRLFQQIMYMPEYYPTRCEMEIFTTHTAAMAYLLRHRLHDFDLVELGAGDATKSYYLLEELLWQKVSFSYFPVDISANIIDQLEKKLPQRLPRLSLKGLQGDYLQMLQLICGTSKRKKAVLFLGGNIGNFPTEEADDFLRRLRRLLAPGDLVLIGFDLKKDPEIILSAYHDKKGITRAFNLNLLRRMNRELHANFNLTRFEHFPYYDPETGDCKSFLVSLTDQKVRIGDEDLIDFHKYETIYTEVSKKYANEQISALAQQTGFAVIHQFYDAKKWFTDTVWQCV